MSVLSTELWKISHTNNICKGKLNGLFLLPGCTIAGWACTTGEAPPWSWFIDGAGAFFIPLRVRLSRLISTPLLAQVPFDWKRKTIQCRTYSKYMQQNKIIKSMLQSCSSTTIKKKNNNNLQVNILWTMTHSSIKRWVQIYEVLFTVFYRTYLK